MKKLMLNEKIGFIDLDSHYMFRFFGIKINVRHKCKFKYCPATEYGVTREKRNPQIIVSLTSYPARINTVHRPINTLLRQSMKPDRVILYLAKDENNVLPKTLLDLQDLGLEIRWCENLYSYKKLTPALMDFPEDIIITADDDAYYDTDLVESLYNSYLKNPKAIHSRRCSKIYYRNNKFEGKASRNFILENPLDLSYSNHFATGAGCLFPPHSLHKDAVNIDKIKTLVPTHDDIYYWTMALINNTKIQIVKGTDADLYYLDETNKSGLCKINKSKGTGLEPSKAFKIMAQAYPELIEKIKIA